MAQLFGGIWICSISCIVMQLVWVIHCNSCERWNVVIVLFFLKQNMAVDVNAGR